MEQKIRQFFVYVVSNQEKIVTNEEPIEPKDCDFNHKRYGFYISDHHGLEVISWQNRVELQNDIKDVRLLKRLLEHDRT